MKSLILVDTCNCLHRLPAYRERLHQGFDQLAEQLLQQTRCLHDSANWELHFIIDGNRSTLNQQFVDGLKTLSLLFAPRDRSADSVIESWLLRMPPDWSVKVVSEDRAVCRCAASHNADSLSASQFVDWADRVRSRAARALSPPSSGIDEKFGNRLEGL